MLTFRQVAKLPNGTPITVTWAEKPAQNALIGQDGTGDIWICDEKGLALARVSETQMPLIEKR